MIIVSERKRFRVVKINGDIDKIENLEDIQDLLIDYKIKKITFSISEDSILFHPKYPKELVDLFFNDNKAFWNKIDVKQTYYKETDDPNEDITQRVKSIAKMFLNKHLKGKESMKFIIEELDSLFPDWRME